MGQAIKGADEGRPGGPAACFRLAHLSIVCACVGVTARPFIALELPVALIHTCRSPLRKNPSTAMTPRSTATFVITLSTGRALRPPPRAPASCEGGPYGLSQDGAFVLLPPRYRVNELTSVPIAPLPPPTTINPSPPSPSPAAG